MRVKQDLLPGNPATGGRPTDIRFSPVRVDGAEYPAAYPIVCAELCGDGHGRMRGTVVVHEDENAFLEQFYEPAIHAILNPPADPVLRGEIIMQEYICNSCHTLDSLGWSSRTGPSLNGIADRAGERVAGQSAEEYIVTSVWDSQAFVVPGYTEQMAQFGPDQPDNYQMNAEQLYVIVAYLCTQGEQSDCDLENSTTAIPEAIKTVFNLEVDISFGLGDDEAAVIEDETSAVEADSGDSSELEDESSSSQPADESSEAAALPADAPATEADTSALNRPAIDSADDDDAGTASEAVPEKEDETSAVEADSSEAADLPTTAPAQEATEADTSESNLPAVSPSQDDAGASQISGGWIVVTGDCSLADAIKAANEAIASGGCPAGNFIRLARDVILGEALPTILSKVTIDGAGYSISGGDSHGIFTIGEQAIATISNLVMKNGAARQGAAILNYGVLVIDKCAFYDNFAEFFGGAIANYGEAQVTQSVFEGNRAEDSGSAIASAEGAVTSVTDNSFADGDSPDVEPILFQGDQFSSDDDNSEAETTAAADLAAASAPPSSQFFLSCYKSDQIRVASSLSDDAWMESWFFDGRSGMAIDILMISEEIDSFLILRDPTGSILQTNDNTGLTEIHIPNPQDAGIYEFTISQSGIYQIEATRSGGEAGTGSGLYTLFIQCKPKYEAAQTIACGDTVTGSITAEDWHDEWAITLEGNQDGLVISMRALSGDLDSYLTFLSFYGAMGAGNPRLELANDDNSGGGTDARLVVKEGFGWQAEYFIRASRQGEAFGKSSGTYELSVDCE